MKPKVFIASSTNGLPVAEAAQIELKHDAQPVLWSQGIFRTTNVPIEDLMAALNEFDFAIFVFLPEDILIIRDKQVTSVRDNVLFELGMFLGKLGRKRNFFLTPKSESKTNLHLPSDFSGITPATYEWNAKNPQASVAPALFEIKQAIRDLGSITKRQALLYESAENLKPYHFEHRSGYFWKDDKKISPRGEGSLTFLPEGILRVERQNAEGRYEIELRREGPDKPSFLKKHEPVTRIIRVGCDAKVDAGEHTLRFVLKDTKAGKCGANAVRQVAATDWTPIEAYFRVGSTLDLLFRVDVEKVSHVPSSVFLRNIRITEED
jgi:hypothetical protein